MAPLSKGDPDWVPANEVHGEGIFLRFKRGRPDQLGILRIRQRPEKTSSREVTKAGGMRGNSIQNKGFPGVRFAMLHTFSHLLIREMALECGYNAASIRERVYSTTDGKPMAGLLLYTAAADSDGTLGGLVELGKPENLESIISKALQRAMICSSDPLCSEHDPAKDRSLHAASCHACALLSEKLLASSAIASLIDPCSLRLSIPRRPPSSRILHEGFLVYPCRSHRRPARG